MSVRFLNPLAVGLVLALAVAAPLAAQDRAQSLADIRSELSALAAELQALKSELVAGGQPALQAAGGAGALDRMNALEAALTRLTGATEALQGRVNAVVADGTNRIGDLEFRLCEMEEGCDPSSLPITQSLGGGAAAAAPVATAPVTAGTTTTAAPQLAVSEQADFDRAKTAYDAGDFQGASDQFATFLQTYTGGPLSGDAAFLRGEALTQLGQTSQAARAYLDAFSGAPNGPRAPGALLKLGASLGKLGQTQEACVTLAEVSTRFPAAPEVADAAAAMQALGCQ
jgi:tol-pal system protein YbgF